MEYCEIKISGSMHTNAKYDAPIVVILDKTKSIYSAVFSPGLIPGINPPCLFKLSAVSVGLKTIDV